MSQKLQTELAEATAVNGLRTFCLRCNACLAVSTAHLEPRTQFWVQLHCCGYLPIGAGSQNQRCRFVLNAAGSGSCLLQRLIMEKKRLGFGPCVVLQVGPDKALASKLRRERASGPVLLRECLKFEPERT